MQPDTITECHEKKKCYVHRTSNVPFCPGRTKHSINYWKNKPILKRLLFFNGSNSFGVHPSTKHREGLHKTPFALSHSKLEEVNSCHRCTSLTCQRKDENKSKGSSVFRDSRLAPGRPVTGRCPPSHATAAARAAPLRSALPGMLALPGRGRLDTRCPVTVTKSQPCRAVGTAAAHGYTAQGQPAHKSKFATVS